MNLIFYVKKTRKKENFLKGYFKKVSLEIFKMNRLIFYEYSFYPSRKGGNQFIGDSFCGFS